MRNDGVDIDDDDDDDSKESHLCLNFKILPCERKILQWRRMRDGSAWDWEDRNTWAREIKLVETRTSRRGQVVSDEISILVEQHTQIRRKKCKKKKKAKSWEKAMRNARDTSRISCLDDEPVHSSFSFFYSCGISRSSVSKDEFTFFLTRNYHSHSYLYEVLYDKESCLDKWFVYEGPFVGIASNFVMLFFDKCRRRREFGQIKL